MNRFSEDIDILFKYLRGQLSARDKKHTEALIRSNPELAELLEDIKKIKKASSTIKWDRIRSAAESLSSRMFDDFWKGLKDKRPEQGIRVFDSQVLPLPAGVRPAVVDTRRLRYKFDEIEMEISLYPISIDSYEIIGRISRVGDRLSSRVEMVSKNSKFEVETDQFHIFRFSRIPVSDYILNIYGDTGLIGTIDIEL